MAFPAVVPLLAAIFFFIVAFALGRLSRVLVPSVNRILRIAACALLLLMGLFVLGFLFSDEVSVRDWLMSLPYRAWGNVGAILSTSLLGAWLATRQQPTRFDASIFD